MGGGGEREGGKEGSRGKEQERDEQVGKQAVCMSLRGLWNQDHEHYIIHYKSLLHHFHNYAMQKHSYI